MRPRRPSRPRIAWTTDGPANSQRRRQHGFRRRTGRVARRFPRSSRAPLESPSAQARLQRALPLQRSRQRRRAASSRPAPRERPGGPSPHPTRTCRRSAAPPGTLVRGPQLPAERGHGSVTSSGAQGLGDVILDDLILSRRLNGGSGPVSACQNRLMGSWAWRATRRHELLTQDETWCPQIICGTRIGRRLPGGRQRSARASSRTQRRCPRSAAAAQRLSASRTIRTRAWSYARLSRGRSANRQD